MIQGPPTDGKCPQCRKGLQVEDRKFYWRGQYFTGLVCPDEHALFNNPMDSFLDHVIKTAGDKPTDWSVVHQGGNTFINYRFPGEAQIRQDIIYGVELPEKDVKEKLYSHINFE